MQASSGTVIDQVLVQAFTEDKVRTVSRVIVDAVVSLIGGMGGRTDGGAW